MCRRPCLHAPKPEQKQMGSHGPHARKSLARLQHQPHVRILAPSLAPALCGDRGPVFAAANAQLYLAFAPRAPSPGTQRDTLPLPPAAKRCMSPPGGLQTRCQLPPPALPPPQAHAPAAASPDASGDSSSQCFVSPAHGLDCAKTTAPAALAADPLRLPVVRRACGQIAGRSRRQRGPWRWGLPAAKTGRSSATFPDRES